MHFAVRDAHWYFVANAAYQMLFAESSLTYKVF